MLAMLRREADRLDEGTDDRPAMTDPGGARRRRGRGTYRPGGRDRRRSGDLTLFRRALYQLSYPTSTRRTEVADLTGFEPATSGLTGRRALQTAPQVPNQHWRWGITHPQRDSNPCYRLERAAS